VWFNVPHKATDTYVRAAATKLRNGTQPARRVYVEYSNETWNNAAGFPQTEYMRAQGDLLAATDNRFLAVGRTIRGRYFNAKRASELAAIFFKEFKGQEHRVVPMLAGQTGDSSVLRDALAYGWKPKAVATAGYFASGADPAAFWTGKQITKFNETAAGYEKLIYEWSNVDAKVDGPTNGFELAGWMKGAMAAGVSMACHFVPLADSGSKYAATNEVSQWTAKAQGLADISAAHPHPYAEAPPAPDPRDAEIKRLSDILEHVQYEYGKASALADSLSAQLAAATDTITKANAELNDLRAKGSATKQIWGIA
jgi:hypothetical protein